MREEVGIVGVDLRSVDNGAPIGIKIFVTDRSSVRHNQVHVICRIIINFKTNLHLEYSNFKLAKTF